MHPVFSQASGMTHDVIGAAIEVHNDKGPGLLESIYELVLDQGTRTARLFSPKSSRRNCPV